MSKIKLKAKRGAPEMVQIGNLTAANRDGFFRAETRELADYLIGEGFAEEIVPEFVEEIVPEAEAEEEKPTKKPAAKGSDEPAAKTSAADKTTEGDTK